MFTRKAAAWLTEIVGCAITLRVPEINIEVPLADTYAGVDLTGDKDGRPPSTPEPDEPSRQLLR